jgi:hypothetical protein
MSKQRAVDSDEAGPFSELAIVDTFTRLIFGQETDYSDRERAIIEALRMVDANVVLDSHREIGEYLRALGVREMIQLVARVRARFSGGVPAETRHPGPEPLGQRPP